MRLRRSMFLGRRRWRVIEVPFNFDKASVQRSEVSEKTIRQIDGSIRTGFALREFMRNQIYLEIGN